MNIVLPLLAASLTLSAVALVFLLAKAQRRCQDYASAKAFEHVGTDIGTAYSDMATVIALGGKVDPDRNRFKVNTPPALPVPTPPKLETIEFTNHPGPPKQLTKRDIDRDIIKMLKRKQR